MYCPPTFFPGSAMEFLMLSKSAFILTLLISVSSITAFAQVQGPVETTNAERHDVSDELRHIHPLTPGAGHREIPVYHLPESLTPRSPDPVLQTLAGATVATGSGVNFDGVGVGFSGPNGTFSPDAAPPDTNGSVGSTQFVQWVNESFAVFDKATGAVLYGPAAGNTLWSGFGGKCQSNNDGDIIVLYDKAANRWVMTQFAVSGGGGYLQCIAISQTDDATGAWYRYAFSYNKFPDYPKVGVWSDAYYVTFNMFQGNSFLGPRACAWDRAKMLQGLSATQVCFQLAKSVGSMLPADLDGTTPPPAGSPNYLLTTGTNSLQLYKFHVDFVNTGNSTLTGPTNLTVASFSRACGGGACIPQPGTQQLLDSLGDRLMYRLAYRNFGDHESLVVNHSIATSSSIGVRWYELRDPGGTPIVYQQGTYAPNSDYRWMGSIAMDKSGNIAVGYSISSNSRAPSIRYTVRAAGDPLGQMGAETEIVGGGGSQLQSLARWGDYSSMSVDPVDDCTFWYTNEYLKASGTFNWSTRIASFKLDSCGTTPTTVAVNVQTSPAGLQISVDGTTYTAPQSFNWVPGSNHTLGTSTPQGSGGTRYNFANWSDGGQISHSVSPSVTTSYTANFTTQYLLTTGVSPSGSGTVTKTPSSADSFYNSGTSVQLSAAANSGFTFASWSGDATGSANPTSVTMSAPRNVTANFSSTGGSGSGLRFVPMTPCRVADTRNPNGPFGGPILSGGVPRSFTIPASSCGIPATAQAYSLNVTVVPSGSLGYLQIWPTGQPQPSTSTLNSLDGRIKADAAIVAAGTGGAVTVLVSDSSHVILDINGYFASPTDAPSGLLFYTVTPCRIIDTRQPNGPLAVQPLAAEPAGLCLSCPVPADSRPLRSPIR
jgi:hypothetical protein